jgi:hypothetical protein
MSAKDVQVLRRFTQKIAAGESMLPDFSALSQYMTPEVLGAAGGAAAGGLGAMGIQKLMRSKEDEERGEGSYMPAILGALAGGAGGYAAGPELAKLLAAKPAQSAEVKLNPYTDLNPKAPQSFRPIDSFKPKKSNPVEELGDAGALDGKSKMPGQV